MRFQRRSRMEAYAWTARKETAYLRRHQRVAKRNEKEVPLFADQIVPEPDTDVDAEKARRERMASQSDQTMRDLDAKHWRKGRAAYFACTPELRARIMDEWKRWTGPARPTSWIYIVEKHNGEAERRRAYYEAERRALIERVWRQVDAQASLPGL